MTKTLKQTGDMASLLKCRAPQTNTILNTPKKFSQKKKKQTEAVQT